MILKNNVLSRTRAFFLMLCMILSLTACDGDGGGGGNGGGNGQDGNDDGTGVSVSGEYGDSNDEGYYVVKREEYVEEAGQNQDVKYRYKDNEFYQSLENEHTTDEDLITLKLFEGYSTEIQYHRIDLLLNDRYYVSFPFVLKEVFDDSFSDYTEESDECGYIPGYNGTTFAMKNVPDWFSHIGGSFEAKHFPSCSFYGTNTTLEDTKRWADITVHTIIIDNDKSNPAEHACQTETFWFLGITEKSTYNDVQSILGLPDEQNVKWLGNHFDYVWHYRASDSVNRIRIGFNFDQNGNILQVGLYDIHACNALSYIKPLEDGSNMADKTLESLKDNPSKEIIIRREMPWMFDDDPHPERQIEVDGSEAPNDTGGTNDGSETAPSMSETGGN